MEAIYWRHMYREAFKFFTTLVITEGFIITGLTAALVWALR